jgi:yeast amino acid transporter
LAVVHHFDLSQIAIGGTIGTSVINHLYFDAILNLLYSRSGLFVLSGEALSNGGPVGLLLGYVIMGVVVYSMMIVLGESASSCPCPDRDIHRFLLVATLYPVSGSFTHYAGRWVDPALGFAMGWNYWYSYAITLPTEITAA